MSARMRVAGMLLLVAAGAPVRPSAHLAAQLAVRADTVWTMAGAPIVNGVVLIGRDGAIQQVGPAARVRIPSGTRTLAARVVTPGLVDAHTVVGLAGQYNEATDQDQLDKSDPIQPELRAFDSYNARERLVEWVRSLGVTTVHTGHGPGALVSGQTMVAKTRGQTVADALVDSVTMVAMHLGPEVPATFAPKPPGTRAKAVAMLRGEFIKAQEYQRKVRAAAGDAAKLPPRDLGLETLGLVLDRRLPALITAQGAVEILGALRLQREFGFRLVLDGAAEAYQVVDAIRQAGVPVILHPTMVRTSGATANASLETAALLRRAGIPFALQSGFEGYVPKTRVVLFEAAVAAANGLDRDAALGAITRDAATIIGQGARIGTLEPGKDGDLALFDGDPFEYATHVCAVVIRGEVVREGCR